MESNWYIRCTNGFFVGGRGVVNPGETVSLPQGQAKDVVASNRGEKITLKEFDEGPKADFKPKDATGAVIADPKPQTRAQTHAAARAAELANNSPERQRAQKQAATT